jgi:hypothetical protein
MKAQYALIMVNLWDISSSPRESSGYFLDVQPIFKYKYGVSISLMITVAIRALGLEYLVKI